MTPLGMIRRLHAPLACLAIACVFSAGCHTRQETLSLGRPVEAYQADNGAVLFGYYVEPTIKPSNAGWHWLIIEPDTAELFTPPASPDAATADTGRTVAVSYKGWGSNARLNPPLLEPGRTDRTPPVVGDGGLNTLRFTWDEAQRCVRLLDADGSALALVRVSPDSATLTVRENNPEAWLAVLRVVAVAGLIVGLVALGGSGEISFN